MVNGFWQGTIGVDGFSMVFFTGEPLLPMFFFFKFQPLVSMVFPMVFTIEPLPSMVFQWSQFISILALDDWDGVNKRHC